MICVCVCVREREREIVCVCVCVIVKMVEPQFNSKFYRHMVHNTHYICVCGGVMHTSVYGCVYLSMSLSLSLSLYIYIYIYI